MIKRAYDQSPVEVDAWPDGPYPAIVERAKIYVAAFRINLIFILNKNHY